MADPAVTIVDTPPPSPPPAPTRSINVSSLPLSNQPLETKKGSAMDRMRESLRSKAKPDGNPSPEPPVQAAPAVTPSAGNSPEGAPQEQPIDPGAPSPSPTPATPEPPKKLTLGQALDNYKKRNRELEAEMSELKTKTANIDTKALTERATALETRNKELENEIRYVNYTKSQEFRDKYQTPYENAWKRAMADLSEVTIQTETGERALTGNDILEIVNMPLTKARKVAEEIFGDYADDVMQHRKEIKRLSDEQTQALAEARRNAETVDKERTEQANRMAVEIKDYIKTNWERANDEAHTDEKYGGFFKPAEGDAEGNQRLAKGFELVDRAFSENPTDPRLNAEQRLAVIRRHAAVRNRAAAFGRLVLQLGQKDSKIAELTKRLAELEGTTPPVSGGNGNPPAVSSNGSSAWDRVKGELYKRAR